MRRKGEQKGANIYLFTDGPKRRRRREVFFGVGSMGEKLRGGGNGWILKGEGEIDENREEK